MGHDVWFWDFFIFDIHEINNYLYAIMSVFYKIPNNQHNCLVYLSSNRRLIHNYFNHFCQRQSLKLDRLIPFIPFLVGTGFRSFLCIFACDICIGWNGSLVHFYFFTSLIVSLLFLVKLTSLLGGLLGHLSRERLFNSLLGRKLLRLRLLLNNFLRWRGKLFRDLLLISLHFVSQTFLLYSHKMKL